MVGRGGGEDSSVPRVKGERDGVCARMREACVLYGELKALTGCGCVPQALIPLCGDDNPSLEIIQRLQKNLEILLQSVTRVSSRSETLGSIHQVGAVQSTCSDRILSDPLGSPYTFPRPVPSLLP